jgi:hypothetical protein
MMINSQVKVEMKLPKTVKYKGKTYKLYDRTVYEDDQEKILQDIKTGKKNGFESIIAWVFPDAPYQDGFRDPKYLIYYRKKGK